MKKLFHLMPGMTWHMFLLPMPSINLETKRMLKNIMKRLSDWILSMHHTTVKINSAGEISLHAA